MIGSSGRWLCAAGQKLGSGWSSHGPPKLGEQEYRQCRSSALCFLEADQVLATLGQLLKRLVALGVTGKSRLPEFFVVHAMNDHLARAKIAHGRF
jgi:hypothetical protein